MKKGLYRLEVYYKQNATESEKEVLRYLINNTREAAQFFQAFSEKVQSRHSGK